MSDPTPIKRAQHVLDEIMMHTEYDVLCPELAGLIVDQICEAVVARDQEWRSGFQGVQLVIDEEATPEEFASEIFRLTEATQVQAVAAETERAAITDPLSVECPKCDAGAWQNCIWSGHPIILVHGERVAAAIRAKPGSEPA